LKNILFLTYYLPPIRSIGVRRNYLVIQHFIPHFDHLFAITTTNRHRLPIENQPLDFVEVHEARTFDYRTLSTLFRPKRENVHFTEGVKSGSLGQFLVKLNRSLPFTLLWGEGGLIYILHSLFIAIKLIRQNKITHIYSSFLPYSDHFTARLLKIFFPKIVWIADFRDLHVEPHYDIVFWRPFQHWCNRQILKTANIVTTVSEGLAKHLRDYHSNVYVFQNGIEAPLSIEAIETDLETILSSKFTILYTGSLFGDERNPQLLLEILKELTDEGVLTTDNFQLVYAGKDTQLWLEWMNRFGLATYLLSRGMVSLDEAKALQRSSHLNVLLTTATPTWTGVMTGKFYEYLAARQPILVLINGTQDIEFEVIMERLNAGCVAYNDRSHDALRHFILELFYQFKKQGKVEQTVLMDKLKELEWRFTVQKLMDKISEAK
jgi:hypothetical protein